MERMERDYRRVMQLKRELKSVPLLQCLTLRMVQLDLPLQ